MMRATYLGPRPDLAGATALVRSSADREWLWVQVDPATIDNMHLGWHRVPAKEWQVEVEA